MPIAILSTKHLLTHLMGMEEREDKKHRNVDKISNMDNWYTCMCIITFLLL